MTRDWNFIDSYIDLMNAITDAPLAFKKAAAIFLISTCAGRKFSILSLPESRFFDDGLSFSGKLLNLWFIFIGKTRISRKSTIVGRVEEFMQEVDEDIFLPQDFTPQSLISNLKDKTVNNETRAAWIHDEVSGFFELLNKGDYMASVDTVLSRIYDGKTYKRSTITRGNEDVINPYLTIMVASTDSLPSLFSENMIRQGFLNRFIYVRGKRDSYRPASTILMPNRRQQAQRLLEWLHTLRNTMNTFSVVLEEDVAKPIYEHFELNTEERIQSGQYNIEEGYQGNLPNMLIRVAALRRIARMTTHDIDTFEGFFLQIEKEDIDWAIEYIDKRWEDFIEVITMMKTYAISDRSNTDERTLERVYQIIKDSEPIQRSLLYRKASLRARRLEEVLATLMLQGRIKMEQESSSTKPSMIYRTIQHD